MIKILYAINGVFHKGGTEAVIINIYKHIDKSLFNIDFLVHGHEEECFDNSIQNELIERGSKIFYVTPRGESYLKNIRDMKNVFRKNKYDIVHSHMDAAGFFLLREAKRSGIKLLFAHSHNTSSGILLKRFSFKAFLHNLILIYSKLRLRRTATFFVACSDLAGAWLFGKRICQSNQYMMFRNAIDTNEFSFSQEMQNEIKKKLCVSDKFVIGHIGRFDEQKNHDFIIDIYYKVHEKNRDTVLILVGEGKLMNQIKAKVNSFGLSDSVMFLGVRTDIPDLLHAMDVLLFPSLFEGLPVVFVEAQTSGIKIIASDTISKDAMLTVDISMFPLTMSASEWSEKILVYQNGYERKDNTAIIVEQGFDMAENVRLLENIYIQKMRG